jgi:hypothetical protein
MPYLSGMTVDQILARDQRLRPPDVARLSLDVLKALDEAHSRGMVHRDLKPANIFVTATPGFVHPIARVLDFGIVKLMEDPQSIHDTADHLVLCTPAYAAPELLRGEPDPRSDLYALGHVMAAMLDGEPPYGNEATHALAINRHLSPDPVELGPNTAESELAEIITRAVRKPPEERFQSAAQMAEFIVGTGLAEIAVRPLDIPSDEPGRPGEAPFVDLDTAQLPTIDARIGPSATTAQVVAPDTTPSPVAADELGSAVERSPSSVDADGVQASDLVGGPAQPAVERWHLRDRRWSALGLLALGLVGLLVLARWGGEPVQRPAPAPLHQSGARTSGGATLSSVTSPDDGSHLGDAAASPARLASGEATAAPGEGAPPAVAGSDLSWPPPRPAIWPGDGASSSSLSSTAEADAAALQRAHYLVLWAARVSPDNVVDLAADREGVEAWLEEHRLGFLPLRGAYVPTRRPLTFVFQAEGMVPLTREVREAGPVVVRLDFPEREAGRRSPERRRGTRDQHRPPPPAPPPVESSEPPGDNGPAESQVGDVEPAPVVTPRRTDLRNPFQ